MASYEEDRWAYLSPRRRDAVNSLRVARGQPPIPPPKVDLYVAPQPSAIRPVDMSELAGELRAMDHALDMRLRNGVENFMINGNVVKDIDVVELPNGMFEGVHQSKTGLVYRDPDEGFEIRR